MVLVYSEDLLYRITPAQQRTEYISSVQVARQFGMEESLEDIVVARQLRWLGHLAWMATGLKKILFNCLPQCYPVHGTKMRWRDHVGKYLKKFTLEAGLQDRAEGYG